ncbi:MAG: hypothetical protein V1871_05835 [Planctomycetota bacterium]
MIKSLIILLALLSISISPCLGFCYETETPDDDQDEFIFILPVIKIPLVSITMHPFQELPKENLLGRVLKHPPRLPC